jgi:hypothetical protein
MMKSIFTLLVLTVFVATATYGQDKNMKFGLRVAPFLNTYKPDNAKDIETAGAKGSFSWGAAAEFNLGENASIVTGLDVIYSGGKYSYLDTVGYFFHDDEIIEVDKDGAFDPAITDSTTLANLNVYKLNTRSVKANYINIPFHLKFKTNEIGYLTYFGQFGLNTAFNTNALSTDAVTDLDHPEDNYELQELDVDSELQPITFALHVQIGAEYNLSGSTSLVFGLFFNNGFSNIIKGKSAHLLGVDGLPYEQKVYDRGFGLSVGIMF